jgi:hypothetical protein
MNRHDNNLVRWCAHQLALRRRERGMFRAWYGFTIHHELIKDEDGEFSLWPTWDNQRWHWRRNPSLWERAVQHVRLAWRRVERPNYKIYPALVAQEDFINSGTWKMHHGVTNEVDDKRAEAIS